MSLLKKKINSKSRTSSVVGYLKKSLTYPRIFVPYRVSMDSTSHSYDQKKNGTAEQPHKSQIAEERSQRMENYPTEGAFYVVTSSASFRLLSLATFSRHLILCATGFVRKPLFETNKNIVFEEIWWPKAKTQTILW